MIRAVAKEKEPELLLIIIFNNKKPPRTGRPNTKSGYAFSQGRIPKGELIMPQKTKNRKVRNIILWFLRLFPEYRRLERKLNERAAIIEAIKWDRERIRKKFESDTNLIESLNRYIAALETKAAYQADTITDLKRRLEEIIAKKKPDLINNVYKARPHGGQR